MNTTPPHTWPFGKSFRRAFSPLDLFVSALFVIWLYLGTAIVRRGTFRAYLGSWPQVLGSALFLVLGACIITTTIVLVRLAIDRRTPHSNVDSAALPRWQMSLAVCAFIAACWLPYLVISHPGAINFDYFNQLNQFFGGKALSNHHPIFTTWIFGLLYEAGYSLGGSASSALGLTVFAQTSGMIAVFVLIHRWLYRMGAPKGARVAFVAFVALCPVFPLYARILAKDVMSATLLALFALQLTVRLWAIQTRENVSAIASIPALLITAFITSLTRANCVYVIAIGLLVAIFTVPKAEKVKTCGLLVAVVVLIFTWNNVVVEMAGAKSSEAALALSIPLEQTAAYQRDAGDDVTEEEREAIQAAFTVPYETLGELYDPSIVDSLQDVAQLDDSEVRSAYLRAWLAQGLRHPSIYVDAFLRANVGYWYPILPYGWIEDLRYEDNTVSSHYSWMSSLGYTFPGKLSDLGSISDTHVTARGMLSCALEKLASIPLLGLVLQPAAYTWSCVIAAAASLRKKSPALAAAVMAAATFGVECLSPLNASMRYALPLVMLAPMLACLIFAPPVEMHS